MESEGPYYVERSPGTLYRGDWDVKCSGRFVSGYRLENQARDARDDLNTAYAEGRKSMDKDFRELLELAEALHGDIDFISTSTQDFAAWKKARGIE